MKLNFGAWRRALSTIKNERGGVAERNKLLRQGKLARLDVLGVRPDGLTGRLRLVLTIGCYQDFRFTRDILSTSLSGEELEQAIEILSYLGAVCDCEVFRALGQPARGVLWHHPVALPSDNSMNERFD